MTQLPYIFEMDPEDWFVEVQDIADELAEAIAEALGEHDDPEEVFDTLQPVCEPYVIDPDDASQPQILCDFEGDTFYIGQAEPDWHRLTFRDDGYWWFKREEPDEEDDSEQLHRRIGRAVVESVSWGDEEAARERAENQKTKRAIIEPFLFALEEAGGRDATAADVREEFERLVEACLPVDEGIELEDCSPDEDHTHFAITAEGREPGHVLAVSPGTSRNPDELTDIYDLDDISLEQGVLVVTDHLRFVWYPFLDTPAASNELMLPSEKQEDVVDYHYEIDWTVTQMIRSLDYSS